MNLWVYTHPFATHIGSPQLEDQWEEATSALDPLFHKMKAFAPIVLQTKTQTETMMKTAAVLFFLATLVSSCVVHGASDLGGYGNADPGTSDA